MTQYTEQNLHIPAGVGEMSGTHLVTKVHASQLGDDYSVMEGVMKPRSLLAPHSHVHEDQVVVVLNGELGFEIGGEGGERFTAKAGAYVIKPRGVQHTFWNATDEPVRYIELSGGPGFQGFVDESTKVGSLKAAESSPEKFGITWAHHRIPKLMFEHRLTNISGVEAPWEQLKDLSPVDLISILKNTLQGAIG